MGSSRIDIINGALSELGEDRLESLTENREAAVVSAERYDRTLADLLSKAPWRFATKKEALSQDVTDPVNEWSVSYTLPGTLLRIVRVYPSVRYEVYGGKLYANTTGLALDYVYTCSESLFPAYFTRLFEYELAARMALSLTNSATLKQSMEANARFQFAAALAADSQQRPNVVIQSSPFTDVRG